MPKRSHSQRPTTDQVESHDLTTGNKSRKSSGSAEVPNTFGESKYTIKKDAPSQAWRTTSTSLAEYDAMDRLFSTQFPDTASELVKRSEARVDEVFAADDEYLSTRTSNSDSILGDNSDTPQNSRTCSSSSDAPTSTFFTGSPDFSTKDIDEFLASNCPISESASEPDAMHDEVRPVTVPASPDWGALLDFGGQSDAVGAGDAIANNAARESCLFPMAGLTDESIPSGFNRGEINGGCQGKNARPTNVVLPVSTVQKGLLDLEGSLQAQVKDQLLQLKA